MIGTYRAADVKMLCRMLEGAGLDAPAVLREAGVDTVLIDQPRARIPFDRVIAAWVRGSELAGDPDFGLRAGAAYRPTDFHGLAVSFLASSCLAAGLGRIARYHNVINTAVKTSFEREGDRVSLHYSTIDAGSASRRVQEDSRASILQTLVNQATSEAVRPLEIRFTYSEPADRSRLDAQFGCPMVFGARDWRLTFTAADADRPFDAANRELARSYDLILDGVCKTLEKSDLVSKVKLAMVKQLSDGAPSEDSIARAVFLSRRSLQRHLAQHGTSFTELLSAVRRDLAERYVRDPYLPVTEISYLLGFSDVSAFSRAFKRWTGLSPAASRRSAPPA